MEYDTSIGYILVRQKKKLEVLILRKSIDNIWDFPKGHFNDDETDEQEVAKRELEEETGITTIEQIPGFRHEHTFTNPDGVRRKIVLFLARTTATPVLSTEHNGYLWCEFEEAKKLMKFPEKQHAIKEVEEYLQRVSSTK